METKKETREARHTGKRLATINALLDDHLKDAPLPASPPILHIVAAFGLDTGKGECSEYNQADAWASLDAKDRVKPLKENHWDFSGAKQPKTITREQALWECVRPLLRQRLKFRIHSDLLPKWKRQDMERIAHLSGFDSAKEWAKVCTETWPPPKSWGKNIDPVTLEPTTLAAKWKRAKLDIPKPKPTPTPIPTYGKNQNRPAAGHRGAHATGQTGRHQESQSRRHRL